MFTSWNGRILKSTHKEKNACLHRGMGGGEPRLQIRVMTFAIGVVITHSSCGFSGDCDSSDSTDISDSDQHQINKSVHSLSDSVHSGDK